MAGALRRRRSPPETLPLEGTYTDNLTDPLLSIFDLGFLDPLVVVAIEREGKTGPILAFSAI